MKNLDNFSHAATILAVKDIQKSIDFYTTKLGSQMTFSWGNPVSYSVLKRGGVSIHLSTKLDDHIPSKEHCILYIFVHDVAEIYPQCLQTNVTLLNSPEAHDLDPDGYIISFGKGT